jgi:CheY-like chemotaxis protein
VCDVCKFRPILVIDDDHIQLELTGLLLQSAGLLAHPFTETSAAMTWLTQRANQGPVTVLMDLHIPDSEPAAFITALRAAASDLRVVGMSASQPADDVLAELDVFLMKPLQKGRLEKALCGCHDTATRAVTGRRSKRAAEVVDDAIFNRFARMLPPRALASLYGAYFFDAEQRLKSIGDAAIICDSDKFHQSLHALKGSSAMLGLTLIVQRAVLMELLTTETILLHGPENLAQLRQEVERAHTLIQNRLQMSDFVPPDTLPGARPTRAVLTES